jgi:hypothetical protein
MKGKKLDIKRSTPRWDFFTGFTSQWKLEIAWKNIYRYGTVFKTYISLTNDGRSWSHPLFVSNYIYKHSSFFSYYGYRDTTHHIASSLQRCRPRDGGSDQQDLDRQTGLGVQGKNNSLSSGTGGIRIIVPLNPCGFFWNYTIPSRAEPFDFYSLSRLCVVCSSHPLLLLTPFPALPAVTPSFNFPPLPLVSFGSIFSFHRSGLYFFLLHDVIHSLSIFTRAVTAEFWRFSVMFFIIIKNHAYFL